MTSPQVHHHIPTSRTSHPENPIPEEPIVAAKDDGLSLSTSQDTYESSSPSTSYASSENDQPTTPNTELQSDIESDQDVEYKDGAVDIGKEGSATKHKRRVSTQLIAAGPEDVHRILEHPGVGTKQVAKVCCGGGCCFLDGVKDADLFTGSSRTPIRVPDNQAFRSLNLKIDVLSLESPLTNIVELPEQTVFISSLPAETPSIPSQVNIHPPQFVQPHPPYDVFSAKLHHTRELTKPGAEKRTYHFDLDVTDYPAESGDVDFVVGGAIGICAPNSDDLVEEVFEALHIPNFARDKQILVKTTHGRWPTIWGDDQARELITTRRELLTWCSDLQSYPPTKPLLRLMAEHATDLHEAKILNYLSSGQGQPAFCNLRTGSHITLPQLLHAFPSSQPPLPHLFSVLNQLMPRFYSLSQDPQMSCRQKDGSKEYHRIIEIAVTVHETPNWRQGSDPRTGVGSGYFERMARRVIAAEKEGRKASDLDLRIPMFRGLMANPLAREFVQDGPMLLIGAGVGVAPFRGFVQRRLKSANCANKVWVLQGIRDSLLDELYSGEWGVAEETVKKVVQSRKGEGRYVQEEVRHQADLVWFIINALDGRIFVCGSSKGMGEGVEAALVDVAMDKGNMNLEQAEAFWAQKKEEGQYIAETW